jgi:hypothetical protein
MTIEDRLRRAIDTRTTSVEPSDDGLERITERLLEQDPGRRDRLPGNPWFLAAAAAVVMVALVGGFLVLRGDGGGRVGTANRPDGTEAPTTSAPRPTTTTGLPAPSTTPPTTPASGAPGSGGPGGSTPTTGAPATTAPPATSGAPADVVAQAVWPRPSSDVRFDDPAAAASSFARFYVHLTDPVVGAFAAGDSRSGEVPVRGRANGPVTTVLVRQLGDGHWYVVGATTADIGVDRPATGATLACPLPVSGRALAFEGTVNVRIDAYQSDGDRVTAGEGVVTGSGTPPAAPFSGQIPCRAPSGVEPNGIVMFREIDEAGDGSTALAATVQLIHLP